jgi:hypothetical protein
LISFNNVWQPRTATIVETAKANDMSIANSFGFEGKATRATKTLEVTRAARDHLTLTKPERAAPCNPLAID